MRPTEATQRSEVQFSHGQVSKASICAITTVNMTDRQSLGDKNKRCFMTQGLKVMSLTSGCDCEGPIVFWEHESQSSLSGTRFNKAPMSPYSKASMHFPEFPEHVTPDRTFPKEPEGIVPASSQSTLTVVASSESWPCK